MDVPCIAVQELRSVIKRLTDEENDYRNLEPAYLEIVQDALLSLIDNAGDARVFTMLHAAALRSARKEYEAELSDLEHSYQTTKEELLEAYKKLTEIAELEV